MSTTLSLPTPKSALDQVVIVLVEPQNPDNIGGVVRAMMNMGLTRLRLVNPRIYDPERVSAAAHRSENFQANIGFFDNLADALADVTLVVAATRRHRELSPHVNTPRVLAPEILAHTQIGTPAILFGREDDGLPSDIVQRAHRQLVIPTDPVYASLNLAQAVLLAAYELRLAAAGDVIPPIHARRFDPKDPPASEAQFREAVDSILEALGKAGFFKPGQEPAKRIKVDRLLRRTQPTSSEAGLLRAMGYVLGQALGEKEIED
jgi:TrmH family RNA methyltransferase